MPKSAGKKTGKVLESYQRVGSRFVPPMLQMFNFDYVSWLSQTMPELIWWDVLTNAGSLRFAVKVAETLSRHFERANNRERYWAFLSDYSTLSDDSSHQVMEHLKRAKVLEDMQICLGDFLNLYPACPISRVLDLQPSGLVDIAYLTRFEAQMRVLEHKRSREAVLTQSQPILMAFLTGRLKVMKGLALADFPEVEYYPNTERSLRVGAAVCATVNMIAGGTLPKFREDAWVQYFWKRSLELHPLNFSHLEPK